MGADKGVLFFKLDPPRFPLTEDKPEAVSEGLRPRLSPVQKDDPRWFTHV